MASIAESLAIEVHELVRNAAVIANAAQIRRDHFTPPARAQSPRVSVEMGDDVKRRDIGECQVERAFDLAVVVVVRSDASYAAADPIVLAIVRALDPRDHVYGYGARLSLETIRRPRPEIADLDALETRIELQFVYLCAAPFAIDEAA